MAKTKDKLYLRFRTSEGKQSNYCPAVYDAKSRIRPGWCLVKGVAEHHPNANYYQRVKRDGKWAWEARGSDPHSADSKAGAIALERKLVGEEAKPAPAPAPKGAFKLSDEIQMYLGNVSRLSKKTYKAYKLSLEQFQQSCKKIYVHQVTQQDLQKFDSDMMADGLEDRTRHNRVEHVTTFLRNREGRRLGAPVTGVSIKIKFVRCTSEAYTRAELESLFAVSNEEEKSLWRFLLGTGLREAEASVAEISDINRDNRTISVVEKVYFGFKPKDAEKRSIPISDALIAEMTARVKSNGSSLLFPLNGRPNGHLLRTLKSVAHRGGLNCGKCVGTDHGQEVSCSDAQVCEDWILHRFRKCFASHRHEAGASARQIQRWLGHSDLKTTLIYLSTSDDMSDQVRTLVNGMHAGL